MTAAKKDPAPIKSKFNRTINNPRTIILALIALLVFSLFFIHTINIFYASGAYFFDTGWYAYLFSKFEILPENPEYFWHSNGQYGGAPYYYAFHIAPIMPLWGAIAELFNFAPAFAFGSFQGAIHMVAFLSGYYLFSVFENNFSGLSSYGVRIAGGLFCAFSPILIGALGYPHPEPAIAILFLALSAAVLYKNKLALIIATTTLLLVRTDAGFHASTFLISYAFFAYIQTRIIDRQKLSLSTDIPQTLIIGVTCFVFSCFTFLTQKLFFQGFDNFSTVYAGNPPFSHVSFSLFYDRFVSVLWNRTELITIALIPVAFTAIKRDVRFLAGLVAVVPWTVLNLLALREPPSQLFTYYAFPFQVVYLWPLITAAYSFNGAKNIRLKTQDLITLVAFYIFSFYFFFSPLSGNSSPTAIARGVTIDNFYPKASAEQIRAIEKAENSLSDVKGEGTRLLIDDAVMSLMGGNIRPHERFKDSNDIANFSIAYFDGYMQANTIEGSSLFKRSDECYRVSDTSLVIAGSRDATLLYPDIAYLLKPINCP